MLHTFLNNATQDLKSLIDISNLDLADIKEAKHEAIFARLESKNALIDSFKANKNSADSEMQKLIKAYPNKKIEDLLDAKAMAIIDEMRLNLTTLRALNKHYARSVIAVREFYNGLINAMIPSQNVGYSNKSFAKVDFAESIEV